MKIYRTGETANVGYIAVTGGQLVVLDAASGNEYLDEPPDATYLFVDVAVARRVRESRQIYKLGDA